jgi:hypothetical protein
MPLGFDAPNYLLLRRWLLVLKEPAHERVWSRAWCIGSSSMREYVTRGPAPAVTDSDDEVAPEAAGSVSYSRTEISTRILTL